MTPNAPEPTQFATEWIDAWNSRDIEAVLTRYADDVLFTSPTALRVVPAGEGVVRGKEALRRYWMKAVESNRELRFELVGVYAGIDTLVLHYRNHRDVLVCEVMTFRQSLVAVGHATHLHR